MGSEGMTTAPAKMISSAHTVTTVAPKSRPLVGWRQMVDPHGTAKERADAHEIGNPRRVAVPAEPEHPQPSNLRNLETFYDAPCGITGAPSIKNCVPDTIT